MRFAVRGAFLALITLAVELSAVGQSSRPAHPTSSSTRYCQSSGGFCFRYPASWKMLGDIFNGNGVVVAPAQKEEQSLWDEITVALIAPPPAEGESGLGLSGVIDQAAAGMRDAGQNFQTLQRQERTVDGKPAEMLKAQYREKTSGRDWVEELVFIEGPDSEIYSVALKAAPQNIARLEPAFAEILRTWTLPEPEPPAAVTDDTAPAQTSPGDTPSTEAQPHQP